VAPPVLKKGTSGRSPKSRRRLTAVTKVEKEATPGISYSAILKGTQSVANDESAVPNQ